MGTGVRLGEKGVLSFLLSVVLEKQWLFGYVVSLWSEMLQNFSGRGRWHNRMTHEEQKPWLGHLSLAHSTSLGLVYTGWVSEPPGGIVTTHPQDTVPGGSMRSPAILHAHLCAGRLYLWMGMDAGSNCAVAS